MIKGYTNSKNIFEENKKFLFSKIFFLILKIEIDEEAI